MPFLNFSKHIPPALPLRLGLAGTYFYSGWGLLTNPAEWQWAIQSLPTSVQSPIIFVGIERYLRTQGTVELLLALVFLAWFLPRKLVRIAALCAALQMASITLLVGINTETFRDIGLLGAALALYVFSYRFSHQENRGML